MKNKLNIENFAYDLPDDRIAKYPLAERDGSKLLVWRDGAIADKKFTDLAQVLPSGAILAFNNTKVVRARLVFHKPTGARIEVFCLEPCLPASYEQALAAKNEAVWHCMVGNSKKFNAPVEMAGGMLCAERAPDLGSDTVRFTWAGELSFGELLEELGRMPIPPYLNRESEELDAERYQTTYARVEGSVAAPTAGLHFSDRVMADLAARGFDRAYVTLHVGAGTFLPVKVADAREHVMHTEHFEVTLAELEKLAAAEGHVVAVGTTSVRTIESLAILGGRVAVGGELDAERTVGQWEHYDQTSLKPLVKYMKERGMDRISSSTQIMITPSFRFAVIEALITNFHQPRSTLLLLISAITGDAWREIYAHALQNDYRFLSYGDSSILFL